MQKIHKSKTPKVYKNKKLNNANFGTYNLNDYQVFLQLVSKLGKVDLNGTYKQPQDLGREHILTAKEFSLAFGVDLDSCYRVLKRAGKKLMESSITLEEPELFRTQQINICSKVTYLHKEGAIKVKFTDDIMPYLAQVRQKFVLYNLKEVANFGSLYSTRLYELIQEFKDTGYIIKSVAQLREVFAVGKKFTKYNDFKKYTFAHAVDEINSQYEMNLSFEELKEGRKVVAIRFEFTPSRTSQGYNPATKQLVNTIVKPKRKIKQTDVIPPPTPIDQLELPNIDITKPKTLMGKIDKFIGATPEHIEASETAIGFVDYLHKKSEASKKVATRRGKHIKKAVGKSADELKDATKKIINALINAKNITEEEAKLFAIENGLI